jgi:excisionase family DNA binding protein
VPEIPGLGRLGQHAMVAEALRGMVKRGEMRELLELALTQGDDVVLSSKEVGLMLGRHHKTVEKWTRTRGLPCVRTGRSLGFRRGDIRRWLAQQG